MNWELWDTATIAKRTKYDRRYVAERIVVRPDFPAPTNIDGKGKPRWLSTAVAAWFESWLNV